MKSLVSVICAFFALACVFFITGCGGGGGNGIKGGDPPPGKSVTLHGNIKVDPDVADMQNPVVVLYRNVPSFVVVAEVKLGPLVKGGALNPYKLVVSSDLPLDRYTIALYNHAGGGSMIGKDIRQHEDEIGGGAYRFIAVHLPENWNGEKRPSFWAYVDGDPGSIDGRMNVIASDATKTSADFTVHTRIRIE